MKLTGTAILVSRGVKVLQAAPAAYPFRSAALASRENESPKTMPDSPSPSDDQSKAMKALNDARNPLIWRIAVTMFIVAPLTLVVWNVFRLVEDYRFNASATERATALRTKTETGHGVLRFQVEDRVIDVRGGSPSATWGTPYAVRYPPGQPELARTERELQNRPRVSWFFVIGGALFAAVAFVVGRLPKRGPLLS